MNLHSVNGRVPDDAKIPDTIRFVGAYMIAGYREGYAIVFNSDGREIFRIIGLKQPWYKRLMFWRKSAN